MRVRVRPMKERQGQGVQIKKRADKKSAQGQDVQIRKRTRPRCADKKAHNKAEACKYNHKNR
jgi:hypothetical protein